MLDDAREIFNLRSNEQVNQYLDRQATTSIEDAITFIEKILAIINKNEGCYWAICLKENPRPVGTICYFDFSSDQTTAERGEENSEREFSLPYPGFRSSDLRRVWKNCRPLVKEEMLGAA